MERARRTAVLAQARTAEPGTPEPPDPGCSGRRLPPGGRPRMLGHDAELNAFKSCDPAGAAQPDELPAGRSLCIWQAALGKPGSELARGAHSVIDHGGIDVQATDLIRISRPPVPHLFDAQHRAALFGGDALA